MSEELTGGSVIWKVESLKNRNEIKKLVLQHIQADLEKTAGIKYQVDFEKIFLVDGDTFENVAKKAGSMHSEEVERYTNLKRPLSVYFSPFRSASTGKVRSKHVLVVDADGKVVGDWSDESGWVVGWTRKVLTNAVAQSLAREFLAENGLKIITKDRIYRLNPQAMKNKLTQFGIEKV